MCIQMATIASLARAGTLTGKKIVPFVLFCKSTIPNHWWEMITASPFHSSSLHFIPCSKLYHIGNALLEKLSILIS